MGNPIFAGDEIHLIDGVAVTRRKIREEALQVLYQLDTNQALTPSNALRHFETIGSGSDAFLKQSVLGVVSNLEKIDESIRTASQHWRTDRMARVDKNLLRLGVYELEFCDDIPATVTINEMIELAKQYGSEHSAAFVNGILDKIKSELNRPHKAP